MATRALKTEILSPILGIDVSQPGEYLDPRNSPDMQNMSLDRGVFQKRLGGSDIGASLGERIVGMEELKIGNTTYLVRVGLTKVEVLDQSDNTWDDIANGVLAGSSDDAIDFAFPTLSGAKIMVFTNFTDEIRKYTGTGNDADLGGSPPKCRYLEAFGGYLMLAHVVDSGTTYRQRVQWSDTGAPETWSGGNSGSTNLLDDGEDITAIKVFGNSVAVHKESSIYLGYLVSTSAVFRFDRKETGAGAVAHGSVKNLPTGQQIFLSRDGFHLFNGVTAPLIPSPIMDELRDSINPQYVSRATSKIIKELDEYWCGVPIGNQTEPETIYVYNYRTGQFYKLAYSGMTSIGLFTKSTQSTWDGSSGTWDTTTNRWDSVLSLALHPRVIIGYSDGTTIERDSSTNDEDEAIESYWTSKDFTAKDIDPSLPIDTVVRWQELHLWAKGNSVDVQYSTNEGLSWIDIDTFELDSDFPDDGEPVVGFFDVMSSRCRFRFKNFNASESFAFKQFGIIGVPREARW